MKMATFTRIISCVFAVFFLFLAIPMTIGGVAVLSVPAVIADDQGYMNSPTFHLQNDNSYAFISKSFYLGSSTNQNYNNKYNVTYSFNQFDKIVNVRVVAQSYFIGLAPTSDVQQYLENVPYTVVDNINEKSITSYSVNTDRNGSLVSDPANQSFWMVSGVDSLYYTPSQSDFNKDLTIVVMKADGSQGINADLQFGVNLPILKPIGIFLIVIGVIFFALTITFFVVAYKSKDTRTVIQYVQTVPSQQVNSFVADKYYATPIINSEERVVKSSNKFCPHCGTKSDIDSNFCETCGNSYKKL